MNSQILSRTLLAGLAALLLVPACGDEEVSSEEEARKAYLGLDSSIDKAISLGFAGFNSAKSASIDPQATTGAKTGTLTVTGKVDQGSSDNKGMRLLAAYVNYSDDGLTTYDSNPAAPLKVEFQLKNIPNGTLESGVFSGDLAMKGELQGTVTLNLTFTATLQTNASGGVERKPGTTKITGTAVSPAGTYIIDVTK